MLTPSSAAKVNTSAAAPGRSGIGMRTSERSANALIRLGKLARDSRAAVSRCRIVARSPVSTAVLISLRPSIKALKVLMIAGRFSAQISSQIAGCPEAMRVISRKPPAAKRNNAACSVARDPATPIKVAAVRCGT